MNHIKEAALGYSINEKIIDESELNENLLLKLGINLN